MMLCCLLQRHAICCLCLLLASHVSAYEARYLPLPYTAATDIMLSLPDAILLLRFIFRLRAAPYTYGDMP